MNTVSLLVDDIPSAFETLQRALGVIDQRPQAYRRGPGISALFCRLHPNYSVCPTFLELVAEAPPDQESDGLGLAGQPHPSAVDVFPLRAVSERQGTRRIKTHATELAMADKDFAELEANLKSLGIQPGYHPPDRRDRFYAAGNPSAQSFDPSVDGGLFIEAIKLEHLGLPATALSEPADVPSDLGPHSMVRVLAREFLVADLDSTLEAFRRNLKWEANSVTREDGYRRAVLPFAAPRSAQVELLEPTGPGEVANVYDQLGPGPWTVRIGVANVAAKAADLEARGTPFRLTDSKLRPDPAATLEIPFEFVTVSR
jgi:hypothetical protein